MMSGSSNPNSAPPATAKPGRWRLPAALLAIVIALSAGGGWLLASTSGLRWAAATVARISAGSVSLAGVSGTLLGPMGAQTLLINSGDVRVTARDIQLDWRPASLLSGRLEVSALTAQDVEVLSRPAAQPKKLLPDKLLLPLPVLLHKLDIGTLRVISHEGGAPDFAASNLTVRLESDGQRHQMHDLRASLEYGKLSASGQLDGSKPFALQAQADLAGLANFTGTGTQDAHISATVSGNLERLAIKAKGSGAGLSGEGEAQLTPYATFPLATLRLQMNGLNPRAFSTQAPQANLTLQADLRGNADGRIEGDVTAHNAVPAPIDRDGLPLFEARAHATLSADLLQFDNLALALAGGGAIAGHFAWQRERNMGTADLSISRLDPAALDTRLRAARLDGSMSLSGDVHAQQGVLTLSDGTLQLNASLAKAGDTLTLDTLRLARGQAALTGQGKIELSGQRAYSFNGQLQHFDFAEFLRAPRSDLNVTLALAGELEPQASGTVRFQVSDSRLAEQPVSGHGRIEFTAINRLKGEAELRMGDNRLSVQGGFGTAADRLQLELAAPALAQLGSGFGGSVNAHASLAGSLARPDATLTAEARDLALPGEHHLASLSAAASLHGEALTLTINATDYRAKMKSIWQSLQLEVQGSRAQNQLSAQTRLENGSTLALRADGGLTDAAWKNMQWQGALTELSGAGALPVQLRAAAPLTLSRERIALGAADFAVAGGQAHIDSAAWTPQRWHSSGKFTGIGLRAGVSLRSGVVATGGQQALRLGGEWDIASAEQLAGSLRVARESGDWMLPSDPPLALGLRTLQLTAHATDGRLSGELTAQGEHLGDWRASIALPLTQSGSGWTVLPGAPLSGQMRINVANLDWLGPIINSNIKSAGRLALEADVAGTLATPRLLGHVRGDDLVLSFLDQGVRLQQGQLAARFDQESLHIDTLSFTAPHEPPPRDGLLARLKFARGEGQLTASGTLDLSGENGNLEISASRLPLAQRKDRWIVASGSGHARLDKNTLTLGGNITADAGLISQPVSDHPQLSDDVVFTGRQALVRKGPRISIDATLNMGDHFYLRASGLEARLAGQLRLRGEPGQQLHASGSIATRDASFEAYGQLLAVERGIVNFQGPLYDPGLNILALRKGLSVEAGVEVTGTALHPLVRLVSTPAVPDAEKLSWIVLGRPPDATGTDTSLLLAAAGSILGGRSGGITGQLRQTLGVDELSLRQTGNGKTTASQTINDNPLNSQIVTVGKRLSARAFLSYEQGVTAVAGVTKLTYNLTPRVNIVTQAGVDNAIDVFYTFSFD